MPMVTPTDRQAETGRHTKREAVTKSTLWTHRHNEWAID